MSYNLRSVSGLSKMKIHVNGEFTTRLTRRPISNGTDNNRPVLFHTVRVVSLLTP